MREWDPKHKLLSKYGWAYFQRFFDGAAKSNSGICPQDGLPSAPFFGIAFVQLLSCTLQFLAQKDRVPRTALFQASADSLHLDGKPAITQALLEFPILSG